MALNYQTNDSGGLSWEGLLNQLGPAILGGAGTYASGQQLQKATNDAANVAGYKPTSISTPGGQVGYSVGPNGQIQYNLTGSATPAMAGLGQFAGNAAGAGSNVLSAFNNFNPQTFANNAYGNLTALAAPGETDQTQQMLNYEQKTGRSGLTQNGQLGDLGGLQLALSTADNQRRLQAQQLALQQQQSLASNAATLGGASTHALGGVSNYNSSLLDMLRTAMTGSTGQAYAGNNVGKLIYDTGQTRANQTGNLFGSTLQGLANSGGGVGSYLSALKNVFTGGNGLSPADASSIENMGAGANLDLSGQLAGTGSDFDYSSLLGPSSAGGEAAGQVADSAQSYTVPSDVAGWSTSGSGLGALGQVAGGAGDIMGIDSGIQEGGAKGYGKAGLDAYKLYNQTSPLFAGSSLGTLSQGANTAIAQAAGQSVASDAAAIQAGNDAYLAGQTGGTVAAGTGTGASSATGAGLGAGAGAAVALAGIMAPVIAGMRSSNVTTGAQYWKNFSNQLSNGFKSGNATYDANTTPAQRQQAFDQTIVSFLSGGGPQSMGMNAASRLPPDVLAYAQQRGLFNAAAAQQFAGLHMAIGGGPVGGVHTVGRNQL